MFFLPMRPSITTTLMLAFSQGSFYIYCPVTVFFVNTYCLVNRVFSGYIKEVESKPSANSWGSKMTFANLMAEFSNGGGKLAQSELSLLSTYATGPPEDRPTVQVLQK